MSAHPIYAALATVAPGIAFTATREYDETFVWDGDGPDPAENSDYLPHDVDVKATAIVNGQIVEGRSSLGGCYFQTGEFTGDVHGYLLQMLEEAARELAENLYPFTYNTIGNACLLHTQALTAKTTIRRASEAEYEQEQRNKEGA